MQKERAGILARSFFYVSGQQYKFSRSKQLSIFALIIFCPFFQCKNTTFCPFFQCKNIKICPFFQ